MPTTPPARLLVAVPTVDGRDDHLDRCLAAYGREAEKLETAAGIQTTIRVWRNLPTCAHVWNLAAGVALDEGHDLLHLTADDLVPHRDALDVGVWRVLRGEAPAALIVNALTGDIESHGLAWATQLPDGTATSMVRIPLIRTEWWHPIPQIHYWSDNAVSSVLQARGVPMVCDTDFRFAHWWAAPGRLSATDERAQDERVQYEAFNREMMARGSRGALEVWA